MELENKNSENGSLKISEDVVATIATTAAAEVPGVSAINPGMKAKLGIFSKTAAAMTGKGVTMQLDGSDATISLFINLTFGTNVKEAAEQVQKKVKESVQNMTGITVAKVNVNVDGITFEKEAAGR